MYWWVENVYRKKKTAASEKEFKALGISADHTQNRIPYNIDFSGDSLQLATQLDKH